MSLKRFLARRRLQVRKSHMPLSDKTLYNSIRSARIVRLNSETLTLILNRRKRIPDLSLIEAK